MNFRIEVSELGVPLGTYQFPRTGLCELGERCELNRKPNAHDTLTCARWFIKGIEFSRFGLSNLPSLTWTPTRSGLGDRCELDGSCVI